MKIIHVVGARPNFMKVAPVMEAISAAAEAAGRSDVQQVLVHTGQHYSPEMSDLFFNELGLPEPDINLGIGGGGHGQQTGRIMEQFEQVLLDQQPDVVLVVGDVNSTIACALDARKLGIDVVHVEAGLRSRDWGMPEEINRVLTDQLSHLLFTTERAAADNLQAEGIAAERIHFTGNVMIDSLLKHKAAALQKDTLERLGLLDDSGNAKPYGLVTLHRPSNVDVPEQLQAMLEALAEISQRLPLVFPIHPRTRGNAEKFGLTGLLDSMANVVWLEPQGYLDFMNLTANATLVLTDSGGIQEETTVLGVPCLTLRENTERPVTLTEGTNRLVPLERDAIVAAAADVIDGRWQHKGPPEGWDGQAGARIAAILLQRYGAG